VLANARHLPYHSLGESAPTRRTGPAWCRRDHEESEHADDCHLYKCPLCAARFTGSNNAQERRSAYRLSPGVLIRECRSVPRRVICGSEHRRIWYATHKPLRESLLLCQRHDRGPNRVFWRTTICTHNPAATRSETRLFNRVRQFVHSSKR
jgi:hypothetical protein